MIKTKKQMFTMIGSFILTIILGTVTYAFFNYTRTGTANTIKTGRIAFNTTQNGTLNLTNVFPVASNSVGNDYTQDTVTINITGDTTYANGIEYLVTAEDVHVETTTGKKVPLTLKVAVTSNLGTEDTTNDQIEYFTDRGGNTSYYKMLSESVLYDGQYLLVGYIAPGSNGINGTINIKAYLDDARVAISDTYPEGEVSHTEGEEPNQETIIDGYNGTTDTWVNNRVVLTTNEWNSLHEAGNELSFKVRVEANEGIWIDPATNPNSVGSIPSALKENITEIYFIKETPIRMQRRYEAATVKADMTDTTLNEGKVLGWQEGNKLYIASTGETYLPQISAGYFAGLSNITKIKFENINTSRVTSMLGMFHGMSNLVDLDLSNFNTINVTNMSSMFYNNTNLTNIDLSSFNTASVLNLSSMFNGCSNLASIDLTNFNTSNVTDMRGMFDNCSSLTSIDLSNKGSSSLTNISAMFAGTTSLKQINMSGFNFGTSITGYADFSSAYVETLNLSGANFGAITSFSRTFSNMQYLKVIDLSNVILNNNISNTSLMFNNDDNLETIYVSNSWNIDNVTTSTDMFTGCTSLVGGNGTHYDANNPTDKTYAIIDGTNNQPGYLTLKTN